MNLFIFLLTLPAIVYSQGNTVLGTWRGTSVCQVKDSPCNNETVVYYITSTDKSNVFKLKANKIVNNTEVEMGELEFLYNDAAKTLTCQRDDRLHSPWEFKIDGQSMHGTLMINAMTLFRVIDVSKDSR
jgi:hypothetical protein